MPKFLEEKLKRQYGANSSIPYKIMNSMGFMHGNKETAKGRAASAKHKADSLAEAHSFVAKHGRRRR